MSFRIVNVVLPRSVKSSQLTAVVDRRGMMPSAFGRCASFVHRRPSHASVLARRSVIFPLVANGASEFISITELEKYVYYEPLKIDIVRSTRAALIGRPCVADCRLLVVCQTQYDEPLSNVRFSPSKQIVDASNKTLVSDLPCVFRCSFSFRAGSRSRLSGAQRYWLQSVHRLLQSVCTTLSAQSIGQHHRRMRCAAARQTPPNAFSCCAAWRRNVDGDCAAEFGS